jgi:hypothetical protein
LIFQKIIIIWVENTSQQWKEEKSARGLGGLSILQAGLAVEITTIGSTINTMSG